VFRPSMPPPFGRQRNAFTSTFDKVDAALGEVPGPWFLGGVVQVEPGETCVEIAGILRSKLAMVNCAEGLLSISTCATIPRRRHTFHRGPAVRQPHRAHERVVLVLEGHAAAGDDAVAQRGALVHGVRGRDCRILLLLITL
jgi:hypothetical protein